MNLEEYRKLAALEERMWYFHAVNRRVAYWLRRLLPEGPTDLLDAGCGTGGLIRAMNRIEPAWRWTGLDFMPVACELSRERTAVEIVEGSVTELPFAAGRFDGIVSIDVLCQVDDPAQVLREFARCLHPGGALMLNAPAYRSLWSYHDDACQSRHRFTRPEICAYFTAAGLDVVFATYANLPTLPLVWGRRKVFPPRQPTSDLHVFPAPIEAVLSGLAAIEFGWQRCGIASPAGSSVFVVGRRR